MDENVGTIIIGAGQAGLAMSRCLHDRGLAHLVLERGAIAQRWRSERWDSFTLLSPNWQTRLPGHRFAGPDPEGFMGAAQVVDMLERYARHARVRTGVTVDAVQRSEHGWWVLTSAGLYLASDVVVATGDLDRPAVPAFAAALPPRIRQLHTSTYRNPAQLPRAESSWSAPARPASRSPTSSPAPAVTCTSRSAGTSRCHAATGAATRTGGWTGWARSTAPSNRCRTTAAVTGPRTLYSPAAPRTSTCTGSSGHGVVPHGHLTDVADGVLAFADDLPELVAAADDNATRFRAAVDDHVRRTGLDVPTEPAGRCGTRDGRIDSARVLDLERAGIGTVIWATGFRRDFSWLPAPVLDDAGEPVQHRGVTAADGLYFLGLRWMHRRSSSFLDGVGADAEYLADHIAGRSRTPAGAAA